MYRRTVFLLLLALLPVSALLAGGGGDLPPGLYAEIRTNRGAMLFELDYRRTPLTVTNFVGLAEGSLPNDVRAPGKPFYNLLTFYRDIPNYVVFTGDPSNDGSGGPGYSFPRETGALISASVPGVLVMDGFSTESHGSRFFITRTGDAFLDTKYTPFGRLVQGKRVLKKIRLGDRIEEINILRFGSEARGLPFDTETFDALVADARILELETIRSRDSVLADAVVALGTERQKTPTGIYFVVEADGSGDKPRPGDTVSVHYQGSLLDGTVFDSSIERNQTFDFVLGQDAIIPGWVETMMDMRPGEKRTVLIPPNLAYGDQAFGPIPANSWLHFEIELVSVSQ